MRAGGGHAFDKFNTTWVRVTLDLRGRGTNNCDISIMTDGLELISKILAFITIFNTGTLNVCWEFRVPSLDSVGSKDPGNEQISMSR